MPIVALLETQTFPATGIRLGNRMHRGVEGVYAVMVHAAMSDYPLKRKCVATQLFTLLLCFVAKLSTIT